PWASFRSRFAAVCRVLHYHSSLKCKNSRSRLQPRHVGANRRSGINISYALDLLRVAAEAATHMVQGMPN
ncbi:MAG: hypothetical protein JXA73_04075, partial [Acidobacteria bacterium]|nr:hypothetical protein [Acidobacteriota bacterium]